MMRALVSDEPKPPSAVDAPTIDATAVASLQAPPPTMDDTEVLDVAETERYRIEREIGRGGAGRVSEARDQRLRRQVAIKQLLRDDRSARGRFLREAFLTARLQHPAIVPVLDAGRTDEGDPFYAMPLVSGPSLAEVVSETVTISDRLALLSHVVTAVEAIAYAHSQNVVHRDIKPHNIVIGPFGETFVVDWGLAKDLASTETDTDSVSEGLPVAADATVVGAVLGTPAFMAPEQARAEATNPRADVYGLGALLYHVLAGAAPYRGDTAASVLAQLTAGPPAPLAERTRDVPSELIAIVDKAMARDPAGRYADAGELAVDLKRFQTGQLVGAHRYTTGALLRRWLRRNRTTVAVATVLLGILIVVGVVSVRNIVQARDEANAQRTVAETNSARADTALKVSDESRRKLLRRLIISSLETDPTEAMARLKQYAAEFKDWGRVRVLAAAADSRGVARHVWRTPGAADVRSVRFSNDGRSVVSAGLDGRILRWQLQTGAMSVVAKRTARIMELERTPEGLVSTDASGALLRIATGAPVKVALKHPKALRAVDVSVEHDLLATAGNDGRVSMMTLSTGAVVDSVGHHGWYVTDVDVAPDGKQVASASADNTVRVWDATTGKGQTIGELPNSVACVAYTADGSHLLAASIDGSVRVWRTGDWKLARSLFYASRWALCSTAPKGGDLTWALAGRVYTMSSPSAKPRVVLNAGARVTHLSYSPSGRLLVVGSGDGATFVLDRRTRGFRRLRGHLSSVWSADFSADERTLVTSSNDGTVRVWDVQSPDATIVWTHPGGLPLFQTAMSADASRLSFIGRDNKLRVWNRGAGTLITFPEPVVRSVGVFTPDSKSIVAMTRKGEVVSWNPDTQVTRRIKAHEAKPKLCNAVLCQARVSANGKLVASTYSTSYVSLWEPATGKHVRLPAAGQVRDLSFSPDSRHLLGAMPTGEAVVWDVTTGKSIVLPGVRGRPRVNARFVSASQVLTRDVDGSLRVWEPPWTRPKLLPYTASSARGIVTSSDGELVVVGDADGTVLVIKRRDWSVTKLRHSGDPVRFSEVIDGNRFLLSVGTTSPLRFWDIASGETLTLPYDETPVSNLFVAADGKTVATADDRGRVRLSTVRPPVAADALRRWLTNATTATIYDSRPVSNAPAP